jgi:AcrR family transcriptional regulator
VSESSDPERPRGRGRPPSISSEKLLDVAREVFLERGIRATTLEVAERAGVSEGTLFHRFGTKDALFRKALNYDEREGLDRMTQAVEEIRPLEAPEALQKLAETLIELGRVAIPLAMMSWSNPERCAPNHAEKQKFYAAVKLLAADLQLRIDRGELRNIDTEVLSRTFIGAIHHYSMARGASAEAGIPIISEGMFVRSLVDLLLNGVLIRTAPEPARLRA